MTPVFPTSTAGSRPLCDQCDLDPRTQGQPCDRDGRARRVWLLEVGAYVALISVKSSLSTRNTLQETTSPIVMPPAVSTVARLSRHLAVCCAMPPDKRVHVPGST